MTQTIRWGILSTGNIAHQFAKGLDDLPDTQLVAVGSRSQEGADAFGDEFGVSNRHASYEALAADPEVDAVYIGTPHPFHKDNTLLCLAAGKAVLCEKPFALNLNQARDMVAAARQHETFLMEAMWTRFLPHMVKLRKLIADGVIGEVRMLQADFGFRAAFDPDHRLFDPALGGGALLDIGVYPVSFAHALFGSPTEVKSFGNLGATGVDEEATLMLRHGAGQLALLSTTTRLNTPHVAVILGTEGRIHLQNWWRPTDLTVYRDGHDPQTVTVPCPLNGYNYEASEVNDCRRAGKLESATLPLAETLDIMTTLDTVRAQWGLRYPGEEA
ncbi:Gfo/Idh/MocA family oxidoreductase [soil metagenome]